MGIVNRFKVGLLSAAVALAIGVAGYPGVALSQTINGALLKAYRGNPTLNAERARQRGTDEAVPQAKSGWRPVVTGAGAVEHEWSNTSTMPATEATPKSLSIQLSQPLFRGYKTVSGGKQARANVEAGRQLLISIEQSVLLDAAQAYMDVIRDRQILSLRQKDVSNLQRQAGAASARFEAGEVTRTDVTQARARVSGAQSTVAIAKANLEASVASYDAIVGEKPGKLAGAKTPKLPPSLERALAIALGSNPNILAAAHARDASGHAVDVAKGDLLPSANLNASASYVADPAAGQDWSKSASIAGVLTVPIYEAGRVYSIVRQAKQLESQRAIEIIGTTRSVRQAVTASWNYCAAARQTIISMKAQVSAAAQALDGVNQEYQVGSRSTIDVLNAEQELLNARISQVTAEHDLVVASYELLASIGKLTARSLGLGGPYYDPVSHYDTVKDKWIGTGVETLD